VLLAVRRLVRWGSGAVPRNLSHPETEGLRAGDLAVELVGAVRAILDFAGRRRLGMSGRGNKAVRLSTGRRHDHDADIIVRGEAGGSPERVGGAGAVRAAILRGIDVVRVHVVLLGSDGLVEGVLHGGDVGPLLDRTELRVDEGADD